MLEKVKMQNYLENDVKDRAALQKCLSVLPGYQTSVQAASGLHDGTISQQQNIFVMNVLSTSIGVISMAIRCLKNGRESGQLMGAQMLA